MANLLFLLNDFDVKKEAVRLKTGGHVSDSQEDFTEGWIKKSNLIRNSESRQPGRIEVRQRWQSVSGSF